MSIKIAKDNDRPKGSPIDDFAAGQILTISHCPSTPEWKGSLVIATDEGGWPVLFLDGGSLCQGDKIKGWLFEEVPIGTRLEVSED